MPRIRPRRSADPGVPGRRSQVLGALTLGVLVAIGSGAGLWTIHERSREALDREMGERMLLIAEDFAAEATPESLMQWALEGEDLDPLRTAGLRAHFTDLALERDLNYVVLYSFEGTVLLDTSGLRPPGARDEFLFGDAYLALSSLDPVHLPTRQTEQGQYLKAAFRPILDPDDSEAGLLGHVAVHAAPSFFDTLRTLRGTLVAVGVALLGLIVVAITVYLFYAQRLARAHAALVRSEQLGAMGRMAAGIAHEIRNPLGIIKNTAQLLREELDDAGVDTDLVRYIPEEVDRLNDTLTGYLEFAKDAPMRLETVDLVRLVRRTLKLVDRDLRAADVEVLDNLDAVGQLPLRADPRRLQQVVLNLVLNAVQAMPEGGTLEVRLEPRGAHTALHVRDTGTGMDPARAEEIFEPFVTSKEKGSGLGLHVVQRIVEGHGGRIELETEPGRGSTFTVVLPTVDDAPPGDVAQED